MEREAAAGQAVSAPGPDPRADFGAFWNHHYRYYLTVLMAIGATMEDAHDTISDVIVDMLKKNTWGRLTTNPKAWVRKAVLHTYYDQQKRQRLKRKIEGHLTVTPESYVDDRPNVWEDWQWVEQMLSTLPPTQRTIIELIIAESDGQGDRRSPRQDTRHHPAEPRSRQETAESEPRQGLSGRPGHMPGTSPAEGGHSVSIDDNAFPTPDGTQQETVGEVFADYLGLVEETIRTQVTDDDIKARIRYAMDSGSVRPGR